MFYFVRFYSCLITNNPDNRPHTFRIISYVNNSSEQMFLFLDCLCYFFSLNDCCKSFHFRRNFGLCEFLTFAVDIFAKMSTRECLNVIHVPEEKQYCLVYVAKL